MHMGRVPSQKCQKSPFNFTLCWTQVFHLQERTCAGKVDTLERADPRGQCSVLHALQESIRCSKQNGPVLVMQLSRFLEVCRGLGFMEMAAYTHRRGREG